MAFKDIMTGLTPQRVAAIKALMDQLETELRFTIKLSLWEKQTLRRLVIVAIPSLKKRISMRRTIPT